MPVDGYFTLSPCHLHDRAVAGKALDEVAAQEQHVAAPGFNRTHDRGGSAPVQAHEVNGAGELPQLELVGELVGRHVVGPAEPSLKERFVLVGVFGIAGLS
ncbi:hypothetical protein [Streptomyces zaomyceticus]|uniref:hypothetical protein n=1 Tax=Streptomyces zaomyceticus TaxID=68286 RepID=UPI00341EC9C5